MGCTLTSWRLIIFIKSLLNLYKMINYFIQYFFINIKYGIFYHEFWRYSRWINKNLNLEDRFKRLSRISISKKKLISI